jgi:hypothetical protein
LVTGLTRPKLAEALGHPDTTAGIPEARWMRAMTFERLVKHEDFVSRLLTTTVGALGLERPVGVRRRDGGAKPEVTGAALVLAHQAALSDEATMITALAVPFVGMEGEAATNVKPDFAIVAPRRSSEGGDEIVGSWLIMGDAKDYERVRSRIDDHRLLKGFLQVALGAVSMESWSALPDGMVVHRSGALAVPRNAFLQPEALVEPLDDHRREVLMRVEERNQVREELGGAGVSPAELEAFVSDLDPEFDPRTCSTCSLFEFCRSGLRASAGLPDLLVEIGVDTAIRPAVAEAITEGLEAPALPRAVLAAAHATVDGLPKWTDLPRIDGVGAPGSIQVVVAKSDAAALGVHGISTSRIGIAGRQGPWKTLVFDDPQSPLTRRAVLTALGELIDATMQEQAHAGDDPPSPIHLVVPDRPTADLLASIADSMAGVEISRLGWEHDLAMGRPALTFDGEPAVIPDPLSPFERLGASFLIDEDRARALQLRSPIVALRQVLARHVVAGGPLVDAGRLDYLVVWGEATEPVDHRVVSDAIALNPSTPGARLANDTSDAIHQALRSVREGKGKGTEQLLAHYRDLVDEELRYKAEIVDRAAALLSPLPVSQLQEAYRVLERDAQLVWRRRQQLHASDLVRFGRTPPWWRNRQVETLHGDADASVQLAAVGDVLAAADMAGDAGMRFVAHAEVLAVEPLRLDVSSRRMREGTVAVLLVADGIAWVERDDVSMLPQGGSFKFSNMVLGKLVADHETAEGRGLVWTVGVDPELAVGDRIVIADASWFGDLLKSGHELKVDRPKLDEANAPKPSCTPTSYEDDPDRHQWCCRSHEAAAAEWADVLAGRRERNELNPETWPPVIDDDEFDAQAVGVVTDADLAADDGNPPAALTIDDID